jgi:hypothetical protein
VRIGSDAFSPVTADRHVTPPSSERRKKLGAPKLATEPT